MLTEACSDAAVELALYPPSRSVSKQDEMTARSSPETSSAGFVNDDATSGGSTSKDANDSNLTASSLAPTDSVEAWVLHACAFTAG